MLYGPRRFARHWIYYQEWIELFNECNPGGTVTSNNVYRGLLGFAIALGLTVAIKRFWIGLRFGKASYFRYAEKLSQVLKEQLLLSKVAKSSQIEYFERLENTDVNNSSVLEEWYCAGDDDNDDTASVGTASSPTKSPTRSFSPTRQSTSSPPRRNRPRTASVESAPFLTASQNENIEELLGAWEDIDIEAPIEREADLGSIIQFRASLSVLESPMPYSPVFGEAQTRTQVVQRSQELYAQLLKKQHFLHGNDTIAGDGALLRFHTIAIAALKGNGTFDRKLCRDLVKLFRPSRSGNMTKVEFCKSVDNHYKELRKLRASIANEGRVNTASEQIINSVFYVVSGIAGLSVMGM